MIGKSNEGACIEQASFVLYSIIFSRLRKRKVYILSAQLYIRFILNHFLTSNYTIIRCACIRNNRCH